MLGAVILLAVWVVCIDAALIARGQVLCRRKRHAVYYGTTGQGMGFRQRQLWN